MVGRGVEQYPYGTRWGDMLTREKNNSHLNAIKHGCCAKTLLLPDECQEDFDRIHRGWMAEFEPEGIRKSGWSRY
ncbi:MAG TPA: hypothetical protein VFB14_24960 [Bryobacteraceae bacterium]|nr:hypothetical protein [Bryobacteraceae bacterium]